MYHIMTSDKVPICSFCEFTKATEQQSRTEQVLSKANGAVLNDTSVGRLAAAWYRRHDHMTEYSQQALKNSTKPTPGEYSLLLSHSAEQMALSS